MTDPGAASAVPTNVCVLLLDSLNRHMLGAYGELLLDRVWDLRHAQRDTDPKRGQFQEAPLRDPDPQPAASRN